ncbi:Cellulase-like protein [Polymorphum gilvum SL003B-26A1]|uniref:Cellulase-like protein n=1 Tax=Polymorphum gilvum (strain LMG 25793 / CGMCC 1.9160 / SL003B-26A1) TaxID=991905 RepID=F2IXE9_POLGS|nr:Cellulase-like protein [Polymorphum gilvum SL003B-26A1]
MNKTIARFGSRAAALSGLVALAAGIVTAGPAHADKIENPVAVFSGLDKITGRIISFDVYIGETVQFGALQVTPRVCYSRPQTETPQTDAFVQVDEITLNNEVRRIFSGWMFAASPGLHAVEHAVYDVWLTDCRMTSSVPPPEGYSGPPVAASVPEGEDGLAGPGAGSGIDMGVPGLPRPKPAF